MMYFLSKTIGPLFKPIGLIWLILLIGFLRAIFKKDKRYAIFLGSVITLISIIGGTKIPAYLLFTLERPYIVENLNDLPECDAVIVLGGGHNFVASGTFQIELDSSVDRILTAVEIVRLGKGKALVTSGGMYIEHGRQKGVGKLIKKWLEEWKLFDKKIYDLGVNLNTRDEAINTAELAKQHGWRKIILVTSASHMRRSKALFEKVKLEVVPVGSDLQGASAMQNMRFFYFVPKNTGFNHLSNYMHEQIGWLYYKLRGWL